MLVYVQIISLSCVLHQSYITPDLKKSLVTQLQPRHQEQTSYNRGSFLQELNIGKSVYRVRPSAVSN